MKEFKKLITKCLAPAFEQNTLLILVASLSMCCFTAQSREITLNELLDSVKTHYPDTNAVVFHQYTINEILYADSASTQIPSQFLTNEEKLLIFVDEEPNKNWGHNCSYYYCPKYITDNESLPIFSISCNHYPQLLFKQNANQSNPYYSPQNTVFEDYMCPGYNNKIWAAIICGGDEGELDDYYNESSPVRFWNDCVYAATVLHDKYNLCYNNNWLFYCGIKHSQYDYDYDRYPVIPQDAYQQTTNHKYSIQSWFEDIKNNEDITPDMQLFIFIVAHGDINNNGDPFIYVWPDKSLPSYQQDESTRFYAYELKQYLDSCKIQNVTIVLGQCYSGAFAQVLRAPGRVILSACNENESATCFTHYNDGEPHPNDYDYSYFVHYFIDAINEKTWYNEPVVSDFNNDGIITMEEAFSYAHRMDSIAGQLYSNVEHPMYFSDPTTLGEDYSLSLNPDSCYLFIRDNALDTGKRLNNTTDITWDSPDIWVRKQADGLTQQTSEDCRITANSREVNIYTKIHNRGYRNYQGAGKKINYYWIPNQLKDTCFTLNDSTELIASVALSTHIPRDTCAIVHYAWELPSNYAKYCDSDGRFLTGSILCQIVCDSDTSVLYLTPDVLISRNIAIKKLNVIYPYKGLVKTTYGNGLMTRKQGITIPICIQPCASNAKYDLRVISEPHLAVNDAFKNASVSLELSPAIYASWITNGSESVSVVSPNSNPRRLILKSDTSAIKKIQLPNLQKDTISLSVNVTNGLETDHKFHIALINENGDIIDGLTVNVKIEDNNGPIGPPIINLSIIDTTMCLSTVNTEDTDFIQWINPEQRIIGEGRSINLRNDAISGEYTAMVESSADGMVSTASININNQPMIESVYPTPFNDYLVVSFNKTTTSNSSIRITSLTTGETHDYPASGIDSLQISTASYPAGAYAVTLYSNGQNINSIQIIK